MSDLAPGYDESVDTPSVPEPDEDGFDSDTAVKTIDDSDDTYLMQG